MFVSVEKILAFMNWILLVSRISTEFMNILARAELLRKTEFHAFMSWRW